MDDTSQPPERKIPGLHKIGPNPWDWDFRWREMLEGAGLEVECHRWLPGDPDPHQEP